MGQGRLSCSASHENNGLFSAAVQTGDLEMVQLMLYNQPSLYDRRPSPLHIAAANGQIQVESHIIRYVSEPISTNGYSIRYKNENSLKEVTILRRHVQDLILPSLPIGFEILSWLLERSLNPDLLNRHKQTPLMLAAMHGKISCLTKLLQVGANILKFDSLHGRTCLHYAAYYGHFDCLQAILSAAQSSPVAASWGFVRFVNIRDGKGATPLHLAAREGRPECIRTLLDNGALASASTAGYGPYGCQGSTPLHLAARGGSLECIRELLAWGADRLQRDSSGRIPYVIAMKHRHGFCAALLNPSSTEPLVWPSPLKFINELNHEAKALLEQALMEANWEREKSIFITTSHKLPSPPSHLDDNLFEISDGDAELCSICFVQPSTIEVQNCGHVMCAQCTLSLCCHSKPDPTTACLTPPVCPFCRSNIVRLVAVETKTREEVDGHETNSFKQRKGRKSLNFSDGGSSSFKGLSSMIAFGKIGGGRSSGRIAAEDD